MAVQTNPCAGSSGVLGSPLMPITARIVGGDRLAVAAEEDHRRRAVAGDVGPAGVDDVGQVDLRQIALDELLAELALHEAVGGDLPGEAAFARQHEEPLQERHRQRVLHVADFGVALAVRLVERLVLDGDVRRVGDDGVVLAGLQDAAQFGQVLALVGVGQFVEAQDLLLLPGAPCRSESPQTRLNANAGASSSLVMWHSRIAATSSRKRAMATA